MESTLWDGPAFKIESALFHYKKMAAVLDPPDDAHYAAMAAAGIPIDTGWQRAFYPHLDAFLMAVRSVPEIIRCCFGRDTGSARMKAWFDTLSQDEQQRRSEFSAQYEPAYEAFRALPLGEARHVSAHRTGLPDVEVSIMGAFGVVHTGGPGKPVPLGELPPIGAPELPFLGRLRPILPRQSDFKVAGLPLFPACLDYLNKVQALISGAREIAANVHGSNTLTTPPASAI
jgi:hypothetical protein